MAVTKILKNFCNMHLFLHLLLAIIITIGSTVGSSVNYGQGNEIPPELFLTSSNFQEISNSESVSDEDIIRLMKNIIPPYVQDTLLNLNTPAIEIIELSSNISETCKGHLAELIHRLVHLETLRNSTWALHMIDSWGKIPEGFLTGHLNSMGDFDECVDIKVSNLEILGLNNSPKLDGTFAGHFCNLLLLPKPKDNSTEGQSRKAVSPDELERLMGLQVGALLYPSTTVCLPSSCSPQDVISITKPLFEPLKLVPNLLSCNIKKELKLTTGDWAMVGVLGVIGLLLLVGTLLDIFLSRNDDSEKPKRKPGVAAQALIAFSVVTNVRKWQHVGPGGADNLACLHGLRFMSTLWVILAHTWFMVIYVPWWNMVDVKTVHKKWTMLTILNATVAVDTFFVMGGMLVCLNLLKTYEKTKGKLNYIMYIVHRYLRLTPTYAILVGIMATLFPYLGDGPYWGLMEQWGQWCRDHWWTNVLYVNNLVHTTEICQAEAWYLSDDMQFYVFTPLLVYPLWKFVVSDKSPVKAFSLGTLTMVLFGILTVLSIAAPGLQVHFENRSVPTVIGTRRNGSFYADVYIKPWARVQTYLVGMWLGYIMFKLRGKKVKLPAPLVMLGWVVCTGLAASSLWGITPWFDPLTPIPEGLKIIYASFHRCAWALSISWIIFACVNGYGGYIDSFLSWTPFVPLGRLSFTTYLVSLHVQTMLHLTYRQPLHFNNYIMTNLFFAHVIMSLLVGFVCTIAFESPFIQLEKLLFGGNPGPRPASKSKPPLKRNGIFYNTTDSIINGLEKEEGNNNYNSNDAKSSV